MTNRISMIWHCRNTYAFILWRMTRWLELDKSYKSIQNLCRLMSFWLRHTISNFGTWSTDLTVSRTFDFIKCCLQRIHSYRPVRKRYIDLCFRMPFFIPHCNRLGSLRKGSSNHNFAPFSRYLSQVSGTAGPNEENATWTSDREQREEGCRNR
jgi:hypothetical protein